ncbi:uncharacterized protein LOC18787191 isoform X3 [Prunus persica]|uniref:uncharacterized protein LOC18787191 isoform X3 n=1 Tax=Prunus persica TaxID=3760 RepID=UPI0009AB3DB9|nr:uncharacterized protein LOC18787191 isoform X3 [Prunus persica]
MVEERVMLFLWDKARFWASLQASSEFPGFPFFPLTLDWEAASSYGLGWMAGVVLRLVIKEFEGFSWTNCFSVPTVFVVSKERDGHCICLKVFVCEGVLFKSACFYAVGFDLNNKSTMSSWPTSPFMTGLSFQGGFKFWESRRFHVDVIGSSKVF